MKKHILFGMSVGLIALAVYAQTGHLRVTVETSPFARQMLTNDTAVAWASIIGINTNSGSLPPLSPAQIFIGGVSSNALAQTISGDASLATSGALTLAANIPRLNQINTFTSAMIDLASGNQLGSGTTIFNNGANTSTLNIQGNPGTGGITVALTSSPSGLNINQNVTASSVQSTFTGNGAAITSLTPANLNGLVPPANLGTGTANNTTYLRGDNTWQLVNGVSTYGGTNIFTNVVGNAGGLTNYNATNLVGGANYAWFGLGLVPRQFLPANESSPVAYGVSPVFSSDGINWTGASSYPAVYSPTNSLRDASVINFGGKYYAAMTAGTATGVPFVQIFSSTNRGCTWNFVVNAYFTNGVLPSPTTTFAPEFFLLNGSPSLIASIDSGLGTHDFRIIQCANTNTLAAWNPPTEVVTTNFSTTTYNDPFLYDDTAGSGNWYLLAADTSLYLSKSSSVFGPWTNVATLFSGQGTSEGPCMFKLPSGAYRIYTDHFFDGYEKFGESATIESGWSSLTNCNQKYYFGHFTPIIVSNLSDVSAASQAASSTGVPNWNPWIDNPTWASSGDFAHLDFGPRTSISGGTPSLSMGYRYGNGFQFNVSGHANTLVLGENGMTTTSNGFASFAATNGTPTVGTITITATGLTNTLNMIIQGYMTVTGAVSWTNYNGSGVSWSTNLGPATNVSFILQPGGKIMTPSALTGVTWQAF